MSCFDAAPVAATSKQSKKPGYCSSGDKLQMIPPNVAISASVGSCIVRVPVCRWPQRCELTHCSPQLLRPRQAKMGLNVPGCETRSCASVLLDALCSASLLAAPSFSAGTLAVITAPMWTGAGGCADCSASALHFPPVAAHYGCLYHAAAARHAGSGHCIHLGERSRLLPGPADLAVL